MQSKYFVLIWLYLLPSTASSQINQVAKESVCRILARNKANQQLSYICSGLLTNKNEITTAEHCGDDLNALEMVVECAQSTVDLSNSVMEYTQSGNQVMTAGPKFKERAKVTKILIPELNGSNYRKDIAKFILDRDLQTKPAKAASKNDLDKIFSDDLGNGQSMLSQDASCVSLGFGVSTMGHAGKLKIVRYPNSFLVMIQAAGYHSQIIAQHEVYADGDDFTAYIIQLLAPGVINSTFTGNLNRLYHQEKVDVEFVQPGDSGGVILCRENAQADFQVVGISSKFSIGANSTYGFFQSTFEVYPDQGDYTDITPRDIPQILQYHF